MYQEGEYDLAGTIVGIAEKTRVIDGKTVQAGDLLLGLPSTGLHTNGYSLARKLLFDVAGLTPDSYVEALGRTVGDELLAVHRSYLKPIRALHDAGVLRGAAHITGGGLTGNIPRCITKSLAVRIDSGSWKIPAVFELLRDIGNLPIDDWRRTFNLGIGMVLIVKQRDLTEAESILRKLREKPVRMGEVMALKRGRARVEYE